MTWIARCLSQVMLQMVDQMSEDHADFAFVIDVTHSARQRCENIHGNKRNIIPCGRNRRIIIRLANCSDHLALYVH